MKKTEIERCIQRWKEYVIYILSLDSKEKDLVSIREYIENIKGAYSNFKEEYNQIEKLNIGDNNNFVGYHDYDNRKMLELQINEQNSDSIVPKEAGYCYLWMGYRDNGYYASFRRDDNFNSIISEIENIDSKVVDGYLDLFGKYAKLFELYKSSWRGNALYSKYQHQLWIRMDTNNDSLINSLNGIFITIFNYNGYYMDIYVDLTNGIKVDYNRSCIRIDDKTISKKAISEDYFDSFLDGIKVDCSILPCYEEIQELANTVTTKHK